MDVYLMQHGQAAGEEVDPARPLTEAGRAVVAKVAAAAGAHGVRVPTIVHSGKLRAEQSATILAEALGGPPVLTRDGLAPGDPVAPVAAWLRGEPDSIALVGHLPFLDRLAGLLVCGDESAHVVAFRNGGLVRLVADDAGSYAVAWALTDELA